VVVTTRLHGLALALRAGVPALAVDPVHGGGKVTAQASAWQWPAVLPAEEASTGHRLNELWDWCLSPSGRQAAAAAARVPGEQAAAMVTTLLAALTR
jgi:hypothetical protein